MSVQTKWYKVEICVRQTILVQVYDDEDQDSNKEDARWIAFEESDLTTHMTDDWEAVIVEVKEEDVEYEKRWADKVVPLKPALRETLGALEPPEMLGETTNDIMRGLDKTRAGVIITYRCPRTPIEAFGRDAQSAVAVHGPYRRAPSTIQFIFRVCAAIVILFLLGTIIEGI